MEPGVPFFRVLAVPRALQAAGCPRICDFSGYSSESQRRDSRNFRFFLATFIVVAKMFLRATDFVPIRRIGRLPYEIGPIYWSHNK
jgi:hypothetical protein